MVVIKPLAAALRDNDHVYSVVSSTPFTPVWGLTSEPDSRIVYQLEWWQSLASRSFRHRPAGVYPRCICAGRTEPNRRRHGRATRYRSLSSYSRFYFSIYLFHSGTAVGDPIEVNMAGALFSRDDEVTIGSVKGNIGFVIVCLRFLVLLT